MTQEVIKLLENATHGTLSLVDGNKPYAVTLNFVFFNGDIYFHCSKRGKKVDLIKANNNCFFSVVEDYSLIPSYFSSKSGLACPATQFFESVFIEGIAKIVDDCEEKIKVFTALMQKLQSEGGYQSFKNSIYKNALENVLVVKIEVKSHSYKAKLGQNISRERFDMIVGNLHKRSKYLDLKTIKRMKEIRCI